MLVGDGFQAGEACWIKREHGRDDPIGARSVAAPATVSGELGVPEGRETGIGSGHWDTGIGHPGKAGRT
jgi:hypothetical protein